MLVLGPNQALELNLSQALELNHNQDLELNHNQALELNHNQDLELNHNQDLELNHSQGLELNLSQGLEPLQQISLVDNLEHQLHLHKMSPTIYAAKFELQSIIHQHVHLRRKSQSHAS
jgi:hypothetical protein